MNFDRVPYQKLAYRDIRRHALLLMEHVLQTNQKGERLGIVDKKAAHSGNGILHKAFSVFVFRKDRSELLLQKRSPKKMLFGGLWANTCCSHPRENEEILEAGERRLKEECGVECPLIEIGSFVYRAEDPNGNGLEHEHDTVLIGDVEECILKPDPEEIEKLEWVSLEKIQEDVMMNPDKYAPWFPLALAKIFE